MTPANRRSEEELPLSTNQLRGLVFDIQRYSIHDGPGLRTLVFMKGCPLTCLWCCNPESHSPKQVIMVTPSKSIGCHKCIEVCPTGAAGRENPQEAQQLCVVCGRCVEVCPSGARQMVGTYMGVDEVMDEVEKDIPFYHRSGGGVTVTGGEPLMQANFTAELLKRCQERGIHTTLETCGYSRWKTLQRILKHVDLVFYDIKHMETDRHRDLTGVANERILQNARKTAELGKKIVIRVPVIPGFTDSQENLQAIADFARSLKRVEEIHLLPYHRLGKSKYDRLGRIYEMGNVEPLDEESLCDLKKLIESYNLRVQVEG